MAKLDNLRNTAMQADPELLANWLQTRDWSEEMRYHRIDKGEAETLYNAIADTAHGVFQWIQKQW